MGTAFLYGNGGSGGTGASLTVNAPAGCTVTVSKDGKTKTKTAGADGVAVFRGLATGQWTVTITDGEHTAQKTVTVTADYSTAITFFAATIHVTYPAGSTCTATDGVTTLTAPDTSGTWDCVVPNAGDWVVKLPGGFAETVNIAANGDEKEVKRWYLYDNGRENTELTGGLSATGWKEYMDNSLLNTVDPVKNTDNLKLDFNGTLPVAGTGKEINLAGFKTLSGQAIVDRSAYWNGMYVSINLNIFPGKVVWKDDIASVSFGATSTNKVVKSIPLTGVPDKAYICACTGHNTSCAGRIYSIWLEA